MLTVTRTACLICGKCDLHLLWNLSEKGRPHKEPAHNYTYCYLLLRVCPHCKHGQLETYSHDCFNHYEDEDWDMYWWYALSPETMEQVQKTMKDCPHWHDAHCNCLAHTQLRNDVQRIWGGVRHAVSPTEKIHYVWLCFEEVDNQITLTTDTQKGVQAAA